MSTDPEIATEEHLDNSFLWNMLMLSQVGLSIHCRCEWMICLLHACIQMGGQIEGWSDGQCLFVVQERHLLAKQEEDE